MDNAASVAWSDCAPPLDERRDANTQLQKAAMPTSLSDLLIPAADLAPVIAHIRGELENIDMAKALRSGNAAPFPSVAARERKPGMQSVWLDDLQVQVMGDYFERPSAFTFDAMRQMVRETPVLNAVILTRIRQVQLFCEPTPADGKGPGWRISLKDKDAHVGPDEKQSIAKLTEFFTNCGWETRPRARMRLKRDNFATFVAKLVRETLTLDSMPIETEWKRDKRLGLDGLYAVDGTTIRLCSEQGYQGDDEIYALQVVQGQIRAAYSYDDLIYVPRNPVADVMAGGYGQSETEILIRVVTGFLNAFTYNTKFFDSNAIPKGLLHLFGNFDEADVVAFKRQWNAMVKGINNQWALPVMVSKNAESAAKYETFGNEVQDAMFTKWMTFLTSIICAVYSIAPDEINFESFTNGTSSLSGNDTDEKISASKDKGLRPLLNYLARIFTDFIVAEYGDKYKFEWTGLDDEDADKVFERKKLSMTWDEMRAIDDLPKIGGTLGSAPLNPSLMGAWQAEHQQQQQDFGQPGQEQTGAPGQEQQDQQDFGQSDGSEQDFGAEPPSPGDQPAGGDAQDPAEMAKAFGLPVLQIEP